MIARILTVNSLLLLVLFIAIKNFQLIGTDDSGLYLSLIYHFGKNFDFNFDFYCGINYLANHFSPFWTLFSPFSKIIDNPLTLYYLIAFAGYFAFIGTASTLYFRGRENIEKTEIAVFFFVFFSSVTVLFQFSLNYNGIHDVLFAMPFLLLSYYNIFVTNDYKKAIIFFLPTLLIKEEFFLIAIFFFAALSIVSKRAVYLLGSVAFTLLFYALYFKYMRNLYSGESVANLGNIYGYIFESKSIQELLVAIIKNNDFIKEPFLLFSFMIPFVFLIDFKRVSVRDFFGVLFLVAPTMGYCFLASGTRLSNFLFDHYGFPLLPVIFIMILKYGKVNKRNILYFLAVNYVLMAFIISQKQPWQYKYYQDEAEMLTKIVPMIPRDEDIRIATDDRSGVYFANRRLMGIGMCQDIAPTYIVLNSRYNYSAMNLNRSNIQSNNKTSTSQYVTTIIKDEYSLVYAKYPFLVFSKNTKGDVSISEDELMRWDQKTIESNTWF